MSEGDHRLVNVCLNQPGASALAGTLICERIELADDVDTIVPTAPSLVTATAVTDHSVMLNWTGATDNDRVLFFSIYRDGNCIARTTTTSYEDALLRASTTYEYTIRTVDSRTNISDHSAPFPVTTLGLRNASRLIDPARLAYRGAFRIPTTGNWAAHESPGFTFRPDGDPAGANDSYPGSLFGTGHPYEGRISEISIPVPSHSRRPDELPAASTLQPLTEVLPYVVDRRWGGLSLISIAWLPPQGAQTSAKLYGLTANYYPGNEGIPPLFWMNPDLADPQRQGMWGLDTGFRQYVNMLFEIAPAWADAHVGGQRLLAGGSNSGSLNGRGPSLVAFAPWQEGNPPADGATLPCTTLLEYCDFNYHGSDRTERSFPNYQGDNWTEGAWLTSGPRSAVMLGGSKLIGSLVYGYSDGSRKPEVESAVPDLPHGGGPGYFSSEATSRSFEPMLIFYDPDDLAAVAAGTMPAWRPRPYQALPLTPYMIGTSPNSPGVIGLSYDRQHGLVYVVEGFPNGNPIIHVFSLDGQALPDTRPPTAPTNLTGVASLAHAASLTWNASTDEVGVAGYHIYRDAAFVATTWNTSFTDAGLVAGTAYHYRVLAYDVAGNQSPFSATATVVAQNGATATYATWRAANWVGADLSDDAISGPDADPDAAGVTNFQRYAFGLAARGSVVNPITLGTATAGSASYLTLTFPRRTTATGLSYIVESSTDLTTWTPVPGCTYTAGSGPITAQDAVAMGTAARRFLRLRLTTSP